MNTAPFFKCKTDDGEEFVFATPEDAIAWCAAELESLAWFKEIASSDDDLYKIWSMYESRLSGFIDKEALALDSSDKARSDACNKLLDNIRYWFGSTCVLIRSTSIKNAFVKKLRECGSHTEAAYVFASFSTPMFRGNNNVIAKIRGVCKAEMFRFSNFIEKHQDLQKQLEISKKTIDNLYSNRSSDFEKMIVGFQSKVQSAEAKLNAITQVYETKLALQAPVKYWETKKEGHDRSAKKYFRGGIGLFVIAVAAVFFSGNIVFDGAGSNSINYAKVGMAAVLTTLLFWMIRIVVRLYFSHVHLGSDAAERTTMVQTYLSLLGNTQNRLKEKDTQIVLQALFRPAADGIVKDEIIPTNALELLVQMGKSKG